VGLISCPTCLWLPTPPYEIHSSKRERLDKALERVPRQCLPIQRRGRPRPRKPAAGYARHATGFVREAYPGDNRGEVTLEDIDPPDHDGTLRSQSQIRFRSHKRRRQPRIRYLRAAERDGCHQGLHQEARHRGLCLHHLSHQQDCRESSEARLEIRSEGPSS